MELLKGISATAFVPLSFVRNEGEGWGEEALSRVRRLATVKHPSPRPPSPLVPHGERETDALLVTAAPARNFATIDARFLPGAISGPLKRKTSHSVSSHSREFPHSLQPIRALSHSHPAAFRPGGERAPIPDAPFPLLPASFQYPAASGGVAAGISPYHPAASRVHGGICSLVKASFVP